MKNGKAWIEKLEMNRNRTLGPHLERVKATTFEIQEALDNQRKHIYDSLIFVRGKRHSHSLVGRKKGREKRRGREKGC